jgi:hypothetical protein
MNDKSLRPIGTRFTRFSPAPEGSTQFFGKYYTWEVVAHTRRMRFLGDEIGVPCEEVRCVDVVDETVEQFNERNKGKIQVIG